MVALVNSSQVALMECPESNWKCWLSKIPLDFDAHTKQKLGYQVHQGLKDMWGLKYQWNRLQKKKNVSFFLVSCTTRSVVQCCSPPHPILPDCKSSHMNVCGHLAGIKAEWVHFCPNLQPLRLHRPLPGAFVDLRKNCPNYCFCGSITLKFWMKMITRQSKQCTGH